MASRDRAAAESLTSAPMPACSRPCASSPRIGPRAGASARHRATVGAVTAGSPSPRKSRETPLTPFDAASLLNEHAAAELGGLLARFPNDQPTLSAMADLRARQGDTAAALEFRRRAFQVNPLDRRLELRVGVDELLQPLAEQRRLLHRLGLARHPVAGLARE